MRYDKETLFAKIEWEGEDGITWFKPEEVPEDLEVLWSDTLRAKRKFDDLMDEIMLELESPDDQE